MTARQSSSMTFFLCLGMAAVRPGCIPHRRGLRIGQVLFGEGELAIGTFGVGVAIGYGF